MHNYGPNPMNKLKKAVNISASFESELDSMAEELSQSQDQLLALFELAQVVRNQLKVENLIQEVIKKLLQLLDGGAAFIIITDKDCDRYYEQFPEGMFDQDRIKKKLQTYPIDLKVPYSKVKNLHNGLDGLPDITYIFEMISRNDERAFLGVVFDTDPISLNPALKLTRAIADQTSVYIENASLQQDIISQTKLQTEMNLAKQVQQSLLPKKLPDFHEYGLDVAIFSRPASIVGGDFYDVIRHDNGKLTFTVGDVVGKGMPAALMMSVAISSIRKLAINLPDPTPERILCRLTKDSYIDFSNAVSFATTFIGQYDLSQRRITYANAGHSPVIYLSKGSKAQLLEADGPAVGVLEDCLCINKQMPLGTNDILVIASDGFYEVQNLEGRQKGIASLMSLVEDARDFNSHDIANYLVEAIEKFGEGQTQADDLTLLVLKGVS